MNIRILFFAAYRELLDLGEMAVDLDKESTVADLLQDLWERGDSFALLPADPVVAVNREFASLDRTLRDGDEVAFVPPVAGG